LSDTDNYRLYQQEISDTINEIELLIDNYFKYGDQAREETYEQVVQRELLRYKFQLGKILSRFKRTKDGIHIGDGDDSRFHQTVIELSDFLNDVFGPNNHYSKNIVNYYNEGITNFTGSPSLNSVQRVKDLTAAVYTRISRNPRIIQKNSERDGSMSELKQAWSALRATLENNFSFYHIKEIVGLAGLDLTEIAHLEQKSGGGASKGQLMTGIDKVLKEFDPETKKKFVAIVAEEVLKRRTESRKVLLEHLERLGWTLSGDAVIPIASLDPSVLSELPPESQEDLTKAAQRLRDGDLSGAVSAACGALDSATAKVYATAGLGDPTDASFQERCKRALETKGVIPKLEQQLYELGWDDGEKKLFRENLKGALNQGAYVMQTLRSKMGDVHGTKPILKPLVFDSLKWAELILRLLNED